MNSAPSGKEEKEQASRALRILYVAMAVGILLPLALLALTHWR